MSQYGLQPIYLPDNLDSLQDSTISYYLENSTQMFFPDMSLAVEALTDPRRRAPQTVTLTATGPSFVCEGLGAVGAITETSENPSVKFYIGEDALHHAKLLSTREELISEVNMRIQHFHNLEHTLSNTTGTFCEQMHLDPNLPKGPATIEKLRHVFGESGLIDNDFRPEQEFLYPLRQLQKWMVSHDASALYVLQFQDMEARYTQSYLNAIRQGQLYDQAVLTATTDLVNHLSTIMPDSVYDMNIYIRMNEISAGVTTEMQELYDELDCENNDIDVN